MAWMYILECCDGSYYVGSTKNLDLRFTQHHQGKGSRYTSGRLSVQLVYCEEYDHVADAYSREKQVQGCTRRKREALINGSPESLPALAKKVFNKSKIRDNSVVEKGECFYRPYRNHKYSKMFLLPVGFDTPDEHGATQPAVLN